MLNMKLKGLIEEDAVNYKKTSMFLIFPFCSFKCDLEAGCQVCQNGALASAPILNVSVNTIVDRYIKNDLTHAIVMAGLEPFDSFDELLELVKALREVTQDDCVIYTGYTEEECQSKIDILKQYPNIIVKFGRFRYNQNSHIDPILQVSLASLNQYAKVIS